MYDTKGHSNNWEAICKLNNVSSIGKGKTKKDAKNEAAFLMINIIETSDEKTLKKLSKKAIINQKIEVNNTKFKGIQIKLFNKNVL